MTTLFSNLSTLISTTTGLRLAPSGDGFTLPAEDLLKLAAIVQVAQTNVERYQDATTAAAAFAEHDSDAAKPAVDWSAAGRKSWETRRRNLASKAKPKRS